MLWSEPAETPPCLNRTKRLTAVLSLNTALNGVRKKLVFQTTVAMQNVSPLTFLMS